MQRLCQKQGESVEHFYIRIKTVILNHCVCVCDVCVCQSVHMLCHCGVCVCESVRVVSLWCVCVCVCVWPSHCPVDCKLYIV